MLLKDLVGGKTPGGMQYWLVCPIHKNNDPRYVTVIEECHYYNM